jgi:hypothetical protein
MVLVGESECKTPLGMPGTRWQDNIKMDVKQEGVYWIHLPDDWNK